MRHEANALRARYVRKKRMLLTTLNTEDSRIHVEIGITVEKEEQTMEKIRNKAGERERERDGNLLSGEKYWKNQEQNRDPKNVTKNNQPSDGTTAPVSALRVILVRPFSVMTKCVAAPGPLVGI